MNIMHLVWNNRGAAKTIVLAIIFIILLAATIIQRSQRRVKEEEAKKIEEAPLIADFNPDDVYAVEVYQLLSKMVLEKRGGLWAIGAAQIMPNFSQADKEAAPISAWDRADDNAIREMLETVKNGLSDAELVSKNREKKIEFRVGILGSKFTFKNEKGDVIACIDVGEKSSDFTGTYVSICDKDEVYKVPGILEYIFKKDVNQWRDKHVQDLDQNRIVKLEARGPNIEKPFLIEKSEDGKWMVKSPEEKPADDVVMNSILTRVSTFEASGFPERMMPDQKITMVDLEIDTYMDDGKKYTLTFGTAEMVQEKLVQGSEYGIIYTAGYNDVDALIKVFNELLHAGSS